MRRRVPQPLRVLLSLRNKGRWNHDRLFGRGFSESRSGEGRFWESRPPGTADHMASEGVCWTPTHKDADGRQTGWELLRERPENVMKPDGPRLFVFETCQQFIRTVPALPRDRVNMDNVDSLAEVAVAMISDLLVLK